MARKIINIDVQTLVLMANAARNPKGERFIPVVIEPSARAVRAGYDAGREEVWLEVEAKAFDEVPGVRNLPQSFNIKVK